MDEAYSNYYIDVTMTVDQVAKRFGLDGLLPSLSVMVILDGMPAGFILNAVKDIDGRKIAWNGSTGVSPKFRGYSVGKV